MLMLRSPGCRNAVIRVIDAVSHVGLIESRSHFSCYAEHPTKDPELGDGRIDLLVEVDSAVIGIEAKFGAGFQADQPNKYQAEVQRLADQLSEARGHRLRRMFLVLAPAVRREEIEHLLGAEARVITWEEVIEALTHAVGLDPEQLIELYGRSTGEGSPAAAAAKADVWESETVTITRVGVDWGRLLAWGGGGAALVVGIWFLLPLA